jgi:S-layer homology domain
VTRRHIALIAVAVACLLLFGGPAVAHHQFPDVTNSNPKHPHVTFVKNRGIMLGYGDGTFKPNQDATRGDLAVVIKNIYDRLIKPVEDDAAEALARASQRDLNGIQSDAPYPGQTQLGDIGEPGSQGSNSTQVWTNDGELHESWVECPAGYVMLSGGFAVQGGGDDASNATAHVVVVTDYTTGPAIDGDPAGSVLPRRHVVRGHYLGDIDTDADDTTGTKTITVRPEGTCVPHD